MSDTMLRSVAAILLLLIIFDVTSARIKRSTEEPPETWTGRWLPERPVTHSDPAVKSENGRVQMGIKNSNCDDAKTNLTLDWNGSFYDYVCLHPRTRIYPDDLIEPVLEYENIPEAYMAPHYCMYEEVIYNSKIPTFGGHRPLWPKYGEYKFVPKQRWLHNLEHGGIVALYHPCADLREISLFKTLVKNCLRRHVITPYKDVGHDRPFVLVAWGVRLRMPIVDPDIMREFIQNKALKGPEKVSADGQFDFLLKEPATIVSDFEDSQLCPKPLAHD